MKYRKIALSLFLAMVTLSGADCDGIPSNYTGSVKINKSNGAATSVEVVFPNGNNVVVWSRKDAAALIAQLESVLTDLKAAGDQFSVDEAREPEKGVVK
jgi:hypothetical protein